MKKAEHASSHTMKEGNAGKHELHKKFHKGGGAMKAEGHHGLIGAGKHKGGGSLVATPSNVSKLGSR